jgi:CheY-like chemotaxis protein
MKPSQKTVLVVDDEPDIREIFKDEFSYLGFRVLEAENGVLALALVESESVDLVVSDVRMPGGDGIEFLKKCRQRNAKSPKFFLVTGFHSNTDQEVMGFGAQGIFYKPFDLNTLVATMIKALES